MSYSNPLWVQMPDPFAPQKAFEAAYESSYTSTKSYFEELQKAIDERNDSLDAQRLELSKSINAVDKAIPAVRSNMERMFDSYIATQRLSWNEKGLGTAGPRKSDVDQRSLEASTIIKTTDQLLDNIYSGNFDWNNIDRGNPEFPEIQAIITSVKDSDGQAITHEYDPESGFTSNITYTIDGEQKTISLAEAQAKFNHINPEKLKTIKTNSDNTVKAIAGRIQMAVNNKKIDYAQSGDQGRIITGDIAEKEAYDKLTELELDNKGSSTRTNIIRDAFNNLDKYKAEERLAIFEESNGGKEILDIIDGFDLEKANISREKLGLMLDLPSNATSRIHKLAVAMGLNESQEEKLKNTLLDYQKRIVAREFTSRLNDSGVLGDIYVQAPAPKTYKSSYRGSGKQKQPEMEGSVDFDMSLKQEGFNNMFDTSGMNYIDRDSTSGSSTIIGTDPKEIDKGFTSGTIKIGSTPKDVVGTGYDNANQEIIVYYKNNKKVDDARFDMTSPKDVYRLYKSTYKNTSSKEFNNLVNDRFDFSKNPDAISNLENLGPAWFNYVSNLPGKRAQMLNYFLTLPEDMRKAKLGTELVWKNFFAK